MIDRPSACGPEKTFLEGTKPLRVQGSSAGTQFGRVSVDIRNVTGQHGRLSPFPLYAYTDLIRSEVNGDYWFARQQRAVQPVSAPCLHRGNVHFG